jgi:hypothetical protein
MEQLRQWLEPALDRGGNTHTFDDVMAEIEAEKMQLWTGPKGRWRIGAGERLCAEYAGNGLH